MPKGPSRTRRRRSPAGRLNTRHSRLVAAAKTLEARLRQVRLEIAEVEARRHAYAAASPAIDVEGRTAPARPLSPRQREVLRLVGEGKTSAEIAHVLRISQATVEAHRTAIKHKLDLGTLAGVIRAAVREGLVPPASGLAQRELSPREIDVLRLFGSGLNGVMIAQRLGISPKTVESHRANIVRKLDARTLSDLVRYAIERGYAAP